MEAGLHLFNLSSNRVLELCDWVCFKSTRMLILAITGDALWLPDVTEYMLPYSGKTAYIYSLENEEVKASINYSLCVSMTKEGYMERK